MQRERRERVVVVGPAGIERHAVAAAVALDHDVLLLSAAAEPGGAADGVETRVCDIFSPTEVTDGLRGAHALIYLGRDDAALSRLTQSSAADLDLLCADTFARAAHAAGVGRIVDAVRAWRSMGVDVPGGPADGPDEVSSALGSRPTLLITLGVPPSRESVSEVAAHVCWAVDHPEASVAARDPRQWEQTLSSPRAAARSQRRREAAERRLAASGDASARTDPRPARSRHRPAGVRSVQRLPLPGGRDARWVADEYVRWLPTLVGSLVRVQADPWRGCRFYLPMVSSPLLVLEPVEARSGPDRQVFRVAGGWLARLSEQAQPRLEFRTVLSGRVALVALHDFEPRLPWPVYRSTQALLHLRVMRAFAKHLGMLAAASPTPHAVG